MGVETWTEEDAALVKRGLIEGRSYSTIGMWVGRSKSAVSGFIRRQGWHDPENNPVKLDPEKPAPPKKKKPAGKPTTWRKSAKSSWDKKAYRRSARPSDLVWIPRTCQFPLGDPKKPDFHFCGAKITADGRPYCDDHAKKCYLPGDYRAEKAYSGNRTWHMPI